MKTYFSPQYMDFYSSDVHGDNIPGDAVEINDDYYQKLLNDQALGNVIVFDESTRQPIAVTPAPISDVELAQAMRHQRDNLLAASDWTQVADAPVDKLAWRAYRELLRQVPDQAGFPQDIHWPTLP
ncbi:tail fiber assembly protein [Dickeya lacustris]|uniref:Tail fiber assembly protein n=1 Tax=Dickeya lacustris TaxID=2259638 RepID=A0ABY8G2N0_9GAMM|nr:tail fiber assembly protein [Dickeya lacustris]WFN54208.1 tail fiber assembly protein [Dickeya lacustris]